MALLALHAHPVPRRQQGRVRNRLECRLARALHHHLPLRPRQHRRSSHLRLAHRAPGLRPTEPGMVEAPTVGPGNAAEAPVR